MESSSLFVNNQSFISLNINDLPDIILLLILSFLPTKYAVRTSVLSRRWRYLWTSIHILDLDDGSNPFVNTEVSVNEKKKFMLFVYKVLFLHDNSHLQRFSLNCFDIDTSHINTWINFAIKKNVQELSLDINGKDPIKLRLIPFNSLVSLKVSSPGSWLTLPSFICLTRLRTLHLHSVTFLDKGSFEEILSSCPVLENLILERCTWGSFPEVYISSSTVRNLCISYSNLLNTKIKISFPNLISFEFTDYSVENFFIENIPSLIDAFIDIKLDHIDYLAIDWSKSTNTYLKSYDDPVTKFLRGVSHARSLTLSDSTFECLCYTPGLLSLLPTFHNLNKLILPSGRNENDFLVIGCLLQCSPALEYLVIDIKPWLKFCDYKLYKGEGQESEKLCLESLFDQLKVVKIRCFGGIEDELNFMKLLLGNGSNLERVIITLKGVNSDVITEISKKLLMSPRASARCIVDVKYISKGWSRK